MGGHLNTPGLIVAGFVLFVLAGAGIVAGDMVIGHYKAPAAQTDNTRLLRACKDGVGWSSILAFSMLDDEYDKAIEACNKVYGPN